MNSFTILLEQIILFAIYMALGILLIKTKVLNATTLEPIAKFVLKLALPLLIFTNTINGVDQETLFSSLSVLLLSIVLYALLFILGTGLSKMFRLKGDVKNVYHALEMFGNIGFMGIPIISSIFPERGMIYIALVTIIDQMVLWTLGVKLTTPEKSQAGGFRWKKMINPATVAVVSAVLMILIKIQLPGLLNTALTKVGQTATPLALIYLGGVFACMDIRKYLKRAELYGIVVVKMFLFPLLLFLVLGLLPITREIQMTMSLLAAMPSMTSIVMMTKASGSEGDYAVGGIFATTVCSLIILPVVCWIMQNLF